MASSSRTTKSSGLVLRSSLLPSTKFCSYSTSNAQFRSSSSSFFENSHSHMPHRSTSPTRVNVISTAPSPSVRFALDRSISPSRTVSSHVIVKKNHRHVTVQKKTCMCSPTNHPGSFRCSLHKNSQHHAPAGSFPSNRLNMRRSAMKNSLVRIGGVEGEWVKRALTALIRPSSHQQRRRSAYEPRPSRLSIMSKSEEDLIPVNNGIDGVYYVCRCH